MSDQSIAFVRQETLPPSPPPASETGIVKWMRENLFSSVTNSILTLAAIYTIYSILSGSMPWILGGSGRRHRFRRVAKSWQGTQQGVLRF